MKIIKNKKGAELPLNVIIIAAIALIVLIIIVFIFTGRISIFGKGLEDCISKTGHECSSQDCDIKTQVPIPGTKCDKEAQPSHCCMNIFER